MTRLDEMLRELREDAGFTQSSFARALGVNRSMVSRWESGAAEPSAHSIRLICNLLGPKALPLIGVWSPT